MKKISFYKSGNNIIVFVIILILLFNGCKRKIYVTTNAFADAEHIPAGFPINSSFVIASLTENNSFLSKEISKKITKLLSQRGYFVTNASDADYVLLFNFNMNSSTGIVNVPHYIPGETLTTTGTIAGTYGYTNYQEQSQASGRIIYTPQECTYYAKGILLFVYDANAYRRDKKEQLVWQGSAINCDEIGDLRAAIDYLLVTAFKYFGMNTGKNIQIGVSGDDEEVEKLRQNILFALSKQFNHYSIG